MEIYQKLFNKDFLTNQPTVKPTVVMGRKDFSLFNAWW